MQIGFHMSISFFGEVEPRPRALGPSCCTVLEDSVIAYDIITVEYTADDVSRYT